MQPIDDDIEHLDLACVAYKACRDEGWSLEKVDRIDREYRMYLHLLRHSKSPADLAPTRDVDIYWHHHILDTMKYAEDCQRIFGSFLHHYPYSGIFSEADAKIQAERVNTTRRLMKNHLSLTQENAK